MPVQAADRERKDHSAEPDQERHAGAVDAARERIPPEMVGSERIGAARACQPGERVDLEGIGRCKERREERCERHCGEHGESDRSQHPPPERRHDAQDSRRPDRGHFSLTRGSSRA